MPRADALQGYWSTNQTRQRWSEKDQPFLHTLCKNCSMVC